MAPGWYAPPGAHAMRPQQGQQQGSGRFHPSQRLPPGGGGGAGMNGGVNSPHAYHQRSSPPMRGPYHHAPPPPHGVVGPPHAHGHPRAPRMPPQGGGRFQMQHPQAMVVGGPRPMPPNTHSHAGGHAHNHGHNHAHMPRHHSHSPGMPRRMQIAPPNAMRPIPQQARPSYDQQRAQAPALQPHPQHGPPHGMHQHQHMRYQQEQQMHQSRPTYHHHHHSTSAAPMQTAENGNNDNHTQMHHQMSGGASSSTSGENSHLEKNNRVQQPHLFEPQPPPGTPEQRPAISSNSSHGTHCRSPSPPPIPPPDFQQQSEQSAAEGSSQRPSPASSLPDNEADNAGEEHTNERQHPPHHHHYPHHPPPPPIAKTPSWNPGPGMGPLRESRLQNMPQKHPMVPTQQHPHPHHHHLHHHPHHLHHHQYHPHPHRPIPHLPNSGNNAYINENMERFRAMELKPPGGPPHGHGMKPFHHPPPQMLHPRARTVVHTPGQQQAAAFQQKQEANAKGTSKKGPDITMDAASMLLALRTSASPSTVSAATLEEQASRDQSEVSKRTNAGDHQDHDDLEDDDVPALASSSSSLSAPPRPAVQHHEVPKNFPTRLALPNDEAKLNSLHCFLRSELLEIFVVERSANKSPTHSPGSSVGRVGLRCVFCAMVRKRHALSATVEHDTSGTSQQSRCDEAPMAVFYPKSIAEIYRLVTSWQRCHLRKCRNLPPDIRNKWTLLRENDKSRGKTHYWITSAKEIGLIDCNSRAGGIRFATPRSNSVASGSIATATSGVQDNDSITGLYNQGHESDRFHNNAQCYQPYNNPNFMEGPTQKQREAVSRDVSSVTLPLSTVESPMKRESTEAQPTGQPTEKPLDLSVGSSTVVAPTEKPMDLSVGSSTFVAPVSSKDVAAVVLTPQNDVSAPVSTNDAQNDVPSSSNDDAVVPPAPLHDVVAPVSNNDDAGVPLLPHNDVSAVANAVSV